jgi:putative ABC transport system permease protein
MLSDFKYAFRQIIKFPGYTAVVVVTLAFGIAVNTQIFGLVSSQFLQPLAVRDPDRLQVIVERSDLFNMPHSLSFLDFQDIRAGSKSMTDFSASFFSPAHISIQGKTPERTWIEAVSPDAFGKYGINTILGRPLQAADGEMPPGVPVVVLTHRTWQTRFGGDPDVIGRTIQINAKPFTIVGVLQPGFESFSYSISASLFISSGAFSQINSNGDAFFKYRGAKAWRVLAYRQPGTTVADTNTELALFAQRFAKDFPSDHRNTRFQAAPEKNARPDPSLIDFMPVLIGLFSGLVLLVLLIACANVANLMGAHALGREKELVVRAALGASRRRIIRQLLVESMVLAALAGITGYLLAEWSSGLLEQFAPKGDLPIRTNQPPGGRLIVFTMAMSLIAGLASGLMPALRASRVDLNESLKQGGRQISGGRHRLRNLLVIGQVAVSCVVLIAAALFVRGLHTAADLNLGFRQERLLMVSTDVSLQGYDQERGLRFEKQLLDDVRALPGVESATFAQHVPFSNSIKITNVFPDNSTASLTGNQIAVSHSAVAPDYIATMGLSLLRGRDLGESDGAKSPLVAVINEAMAKTLWPGKDAIGQHFHLDWNGSPPVEVVGVVATGKYLMLTEEPRPYFYIPFAQRYGMPATLIVRALGNPASLTKSVRDAIHHLDPDLPVYDLLTFDDHLANSFMALMPLRMGATIAGIQGALALLLAVLGLYAVVSFGVTNRTREIGVRMALGASSKNVLQLVASEGLRLTLIGLGIGLVLALAVAFGLSRVVFGVSAFDPVALAVVVTLLTATAALACWLPARRATKVDPMVALRAE